MSVSSSITLDKFKPRPIRKIKANNILTGLRFNSWLVLSEAHIPNQSQRYYLCKCKCGLEKIIASQSLTQNRSRQCRECAFYTHRLTHTPTYKIWGGVISRCSSPKVKIYKYYGGRGIKVCERWRKFENFLKDMGERPPGMQIDRIDNDGNYEPSNCHWVTKKENLLNKRPTPTLTGRKIGSWTVKEEIAQSNKTHKFYNCVCDCGLTKIKCGSDLIRSKFPKCRRCAAVFHGEYWAQRRSIAR